MDFWDYFRWAVYIGLGLAVIGAFFRYRAPMFELAGEVKVELDKCSWPWDPNQTGFKKYKELIESTVVVVISVVLLAGYVTMWDFLLSHFVGWMTGASFYK